VARELRELRLLDRLLRRLPHGVHGRIIPPMRQDCPMTTTIAFLGLGAVGSRMAANLQAAGEKPKT
jgi:hypothetical protein